jgi:hypothetical protein
MRELCANYALTHALTHATYAHTHTHAWMRASHEFLHTRDVHTLTHTDTTLTTHTHTRRAIDKDQFKDVAKRATQKILEGQLKVDPKVRVWLRWVGGVRGASVRDGGWGALGGRCYLLS